MSRAERVSAELEDAYVLLHEKKIGNLRELLPLLDPDEILVREDGLNVLCPVPDDHQAPLAAGSPGRVEHPLQKRLAGGFVEHFWQERPHPRALASCEHDSY